MTSLSYRGIKQCPSAIHIVFLAAAMLFYLSQSIAQEELTLESGMGIVDLVQGYGDAAHLGDIVVIHLKAWTDEDGVTGKIFADTIELGEPLSFVLGTDRVLPAWNEGVTGMKPGGKRRLFVPHELGVGATGEGQLILENTDVIFEIELIEIRLQTED